MLSKFCGHVVRFGREEQGNAVTEYAVMLSLIVIAALAGLFALGDKIVAVFEYDYTHIGDIADDMG